MYVCTYWYDHSIYSWLILIYELNVLKRILQSFQMSRAAQGCLTIHNIECAYRMSNVFINCKQPIILRTSKFQFRTRFAVTISESLVAHENSMIGPVPLDRLDFLDCCPSIDHFLWQLPVINKLIIRIWILWRFSIKSFLCTSYRQCNILV